MSKPKRPYGSRFRDALVMLKQRMTLGSFLYENEIETGPLLLIPDLHRTKDR